MSGDVLLERLGGLGIVTLNRPQVLNTISLEMYREIDPALLAWREDPSVMAVLTRGAGDRAFCAGGDVVAVYRARSEPPGPDDYKALFFAEEYRLIRRVHRYPKPTIALVDGITMGGGVGVSVNGRFRVATERTVFAMPEVHIGLFPDVGATRFLNRCPGRIGLYLALTGARVGPADALYCGLATHFVPHEKVGALTEALTKDSGERAIETTLARFAGDPGAATLPPLKDAIDRCFAADSVGGIMARLVREDGAWAKEAHDQMSRASPISMAITFRQVTEGAGMNVEAALTLEYRMTQHCMAGDDFYEGIRAVLVDKDRKPRWRHAARDKVSAAEIDSYFTPLGAGELSFA
ncbi:MAG TPA: enoyl-CoA hydratase/isomerase family protein [Stellaceae bacterium]|nr:enoyl-CoA hydratase/isomerase family protein [Stellaceae bacterium]